MSARRQDYLMETPFDWSSRYAVLYEDAKRTAWDPAAIDLTRDADDWEMLRREYAKEQFAEQVNLLCSLFYAGEQSVTQTLSPFLHAMSRAGLGLEKELFLASQLLDESRHYEFFSRYFRGAIGGEMMRLPIPAEPQSLLIDDLDAVANRIRCEDDPSRLRELLVEGVTHYMGVVEGMLARTGYRGVHEALASRGWLPGLQEGFVHIRRDEGRHVAFGIHFMREMVARDPSYAEIVHTTFERHLPNVLATIARFHSFPVPIVALEPLQQYAIDTYEHFMSAIQGTAAVDEEE